MVASHAAQCVVLGVNKPLWPHTVAAVAAAARPFRGASQQERSRDVAHCLSCAANGNGRLTGTRWTRIWSSLRLMGPTVGAEAPSAATAAATRGDDRHCVAAKAVAHGGPQPLCSAAQE